MNRSGPSHRSRTNLTRASQRTAGVSMLALLLGGSLIAGCASSQNKADSTSTGASSSTSRSRSTTAPSTAAEPDLSYPAELDAAYLVGPTPARELDLRIDWQARVLPTANSGIKLLAVEEDSVFVVDGQNMLTRLRRESGERVWQLPVAGPVDEVFGLLYMPESERVYVAVSDALLAFESSVGSLVGRQPFERIANTPPVRFGNSILYGARNGQLVWHSYAVGTQFRAYQVDNTLRTKPVIDGQTVIVTGANGMVMAINASSASQIWSKKLLDEIAAPPAAGEGAVFVAGVDQSLWAFDMSNGRGLWRYRTESPLTEPPVLLGDRVYQFVPGKGILCLEAIPLDEPGGVVLWESPSASGRVVMQRRDMVYAWDQSKRTLTVINTAKGHVIKSVSLPSVKHLFVTNPDGGDFYAAGDDGRVIHLVWRN